jgi:hypothetical protein
MTFAYVENNEIVQISSADVVEWKNETIQHPRLLSIEERKAKGIYEFINSNSTPLFYTAGNVTYTIDKEAGAVYETPELTVNPIETIKEFKLKQLSDVRLETETAGIEVDGFTYLTDKPSQAAINDAFTRIQQNLGLVIDWKANNKWIQLTSANISDVYQAIGTHVQTCYTKEKALSDIINNFTDENINELIEYDVKNSWEAN